MKTAETQPIAGGRFLKSNLPSHFLLGFATLFDLQGILSTESRDALSQCSDAEAIYSDWLTVFGDLQDAFQQVTDGAQQEETI